MDIKQIGDNIKKCRELKNITRKDMDEKVDMGLSGYSKIERGEVVPTLTCIQKNSEVLEVELAQVLNFDATQIFNISHNNTIQGVNNTHIHSNEYKDKYIQKLEEDNERLKKDSEH